MTGQGWEAGLSLLIGAFPASVGLATLWSSGVRVALPRPQLSSPVSAWWVPQSRGHCPFNSCPGRSWAVLATARARPPIRARAPAGPPPLAPAPARAARAGAGRWRRYCCRPRGASPPPAARGPGEGRGQPRTGPGSPPLPSHASRKVCPFALCPAAPGAPRRRGFSPQPQLARPGPQCRMGLLLRGPVAARTDTAPLVWGQDAS